MFCFVFPFLDLPKMVSDSEFPALLEECLTDTIPDLEIRAVVKNHINTQIAQLQQSMNLSGAWPTKHQCFVYLLMQAANEMASRSCSQQA